MHLAKRGRVQMLRRGDMRFFSRNPAQQAQLSTNEGQVF